MSNYLAIATVTAALQRLLQTGIREDVPGANVTTMRPDNPAAMSLSVGINVYLYQATPNPAWRNADLRTRRPKGDLIKHGQAGLDLHYLLTFYGNEQELEPQRLMGSAIKTLVDQPTLTQDSIRQTIEYSNLPFLASSTLDDQVQLVQFIPSSITTEDLSRIWSVFFQIPYSLSFAYQGMAVLIQGDKPGKAALPVRKRQFNVSFNRLHIEQVELENTLEQAVTQRSRLVLKGQNLWHPHAQVQIGDVKVTPQEVTDTKIVVDLSALNDSEAQLLKAGVQGVQVIHPPAQFQVSTSYSAGIESNVLPLVLCPVILEEPERPLVTVEERDEERYSGTVTVQADINIVPNQRVFLILNGLADEQPDSYIFRAARRVDVTTTMTFPIENIAAGSYLIRLQVDGAESPLRVDDEDRYIGPAIVVP